MEILQIFLVILIFLIIIAIIGILYFLYLDKKLTSISTTPTPFQTNQPTPFSTESPTKQPTPFSTYYPNQPTPFSTGSPTPFQTNQPTPFSTESPPTISPTPFQTNKPTPFSTESPIDCVLSDWSTPSPCDKNCGGGNQERTRDILVQPQYGGITCPPLSTISPCNTQECPIDCLVSEWSTPSPCDKDCGGGNQERTRDILVQPQYGGITCPPLSTISPCNTQECPIDCLVSEWSTPSPCDKDCGGGNQTQTRTVLIEPKYGGITCPPLSTISPCNTQECPIDCLVSEWSTPSPCDKDCGGGNQTQTRTVLIEPKYGGITCPPLSTISPCNTQECPIDCLVSEWSTPSPCDKDCGGGNQTQTRTVLIEPKYGGITCPPLSTISPCNTQECPIDCLVSEWSTPSPCDKNCGGGNQERTRDILVQPQYGGITCPPLSTISPCNTQECPIDCVLSDWSTPSPCDQECGGGKQIKTRTVFIQPQYGGATCSPLLELSIDCNRFPCAPISVTFEPTTTATAMKISWIDPNPKGTVTEYRINCITLGTEYRTTTTSYILENLTPSTMYSITISCANTFGYGLTSDIVSALTLPNPPTGITVTSDPTNVYVSWDNYPTTLTQYAIYLNGEVHGYVPYVEYDTNSTYSYKIPDRISATLYTINLSAENTSGFGPLSNNFLIYTQPSKPTIMDVTALYGKVSLKWKNNEGVVNGFRVKIYDSTSMNTITTAPSLSPSLSGVGIFEFPSDVTDCTIQGLINGRSYTVEVSSKNLANVYGPSEATTQTPITYPEPPVLTATKTGGTSIMLEWTVPESYGKSIDYYNVYVNDVFTQKVVGSTTYTVNNLSVGQTYTFRVSAYSSLGEGGLSTKTEPILIVLPPTVVSGESLVLTPVDGEVKISWPRVDGDDGGVSPVTYTIDCYNTQTDNKVGQISGTSTTQTYTGLTVGQTYYFMITPENKVGKGPEKKTNTIYIYGTPKITLTSATISSRILTVKYKVTDSGGATKGADGKYNLGISLSINNGLNYPYLSLPLPNLDLSTYSTEELVYKMDSQLIDGTYSIIVRGIVGDSKNSKTGDSNIITRTLLLWEKTLVSNKSVYNSWGSKTLGDFILPSNKDGYLKYAVSAKTLSGYSNFYSQGFAIIFSNPKFEEDKVFTNFSTNYKEQTYTYTGTQTSFYVSYDVFAVPPDVGLDIEYIKVSCDTVS